MRVIAGSWRGRPLAAPTGAATRPTADRVRETLFSMLYSRLGSFEGLMVADLFAGSGALGIEALSRGAAHCLFVDRERAAVDAIRKNLGTVDAMKLADVRQADVLSLGPAQRALDLLMIDPPYDTGAGSVAVDKLARLGWIGPASWVSIETGASEVVTVSGTTLDAERRIGKAKISLLRLA